MLVNRLSDKVRRDIARSNSGEKPAGKDAAPKRKYTPKPKPNAKSETFDPSEIQDLPKGFLSKVVHAQDTIPEEKRHNTELMHVSGLLKDTCARQIRFTDRNPENKQYENVLGAHRVMWKIGRAVEKHVRDSYIAGIKGKGVFGEWSCVCGATKKVGVFEEHWAACNRCRTKPTEYGELSLMDVDNGVVGNPDMMAYIGGPLRIIEIKSMNAKDFDALTEAVPDHIYQAASYVRLARLNGYEVSNTVIVHYTKKEFKYEMPYKEFHVDTGSKMIQNVLDNMWKGAKFIADSRRNNTMPKNRICNSSNSARAKKCQHCVDCFAGG